MDLIDKQNNIRLLTAFECAAAVLAMKIPLVGKEGKSRNMAFKINGCFLCQAYTFM